MGCFPADRVVRGRLDDRVELVEVVRGKPLLDDARCQPELKGQVGERMPPDREGDVCRRDLPLGRGRLDEG